MKHLGDITKINGSAVPVVDCVIGGSPCQDLSVAGKRAGLAGERSGLYMEQIRIIKEMRREDELRGRSGVDVRPRYMVWENVPGAFSSNKGQDFAAVLEEAIRVSEPEAPAVGVPEKGWPTSGCFFDELGRWSVAWRVLDAQFWGVPQRRRRIALVADFGGLSAPEILFVRKSVSGHPEPGEPEGEEAAGDAGAGTGGAVEVDGHILDDQGGAQISVRRDGKAPTLRAEMHGNIPCVMQSAGVDLYNGAVTGDVAATMNANSGTSANHAGPCVCVGVLGSSAVNTEITDGTIAPCLMARAGTGGNQLPLVAVRTWDERGNGDGDTVNTITGDHNNRITDYTSVVVEKVPAGYGINGDVAGTLDASYYKGCGMRQGIEREVVAAALCAGVDCRNLTETPELYQTLQAKPNGGQSLNYSGAVRIRYIVRRLTPWECERLQGFPDGWTDIGEWVDSKGKKHKEADSPRYKALGNSIAIPPWKWVLKRLCACYERDATMASLFDGIGGFPYIWEQLNGKGSCLWASEIEEFPMAVTKLRFGGGA